MAKKSAKQENVQTITMVLNGGLNYSQSRANIADNELTRARNFIYDPATDFLMTRPGTDCITASALPSPITSACYFEYATGAKHVCAAGTKLYYLNGTSYVEIGTDVLSGDYPPCFLTFNNLLLVADGSDHIYTWNGVDTYAALATSPPATALSMIKNRVVANHLTELDSVYFSKPEDATDWNTGGSAVGLKAGFGDMLAVNAFAVYGDDLIISKLGDKEKRLYRVNVAGATTAWYVQDLSQNNAAQNAHTMLGAWNNVYFVDSNGFKSVKGTETYGDLQVDAIGRKINTMFQQGYTCDGIVYLPSYNAVWFNIGDRIFCYTERYDPESEGYRRPAFTDIFFEWGRCTSMYEAGDTVYLTGYNGYLYHLDETLSTDETSPGVTVNYVSAIRTKTVSFFVDGILRKLQFYLKPKATGAGNINVCTEENTKAIITTLATLPEGEYLYDATGKFSSDVPDPSQPDNWTDITGFLFDTGASPWIETSRNRLRKDEMAFELELTSGRCGIEWCKAEIALVEGGD